MKEKVESCSWWGAVKLQEAKRGYEDKFPEFVVWSRVRSSHGTLTQLQNTHVMSSVVSECR